MKKMIFALVTMLTLSLSASAMSYEQARNEALFLTDKMAYELNLTDAQYEAAYEINLDYLMGVTSQTETSTFSTSSTLGNGRLSVPPPISTVRCIGTLVSGTSASMPAIPIVTTSTSDARTSMLPIAAVMPGTSVATATTTAALLTIVLNLPTDASTSACATALTVVTSATDAATAPPA